MIVRAIKSRTVTLEMMAVAGLLAMEASVVNRPLFLSRWADVGVDALTIFVQGNETRDIVGRKLS